MSSTRSSRSLPTLQSARQTAAARGFTRPSSRVCPTTAPSRPRRATRASSFSHSYRRGHLRPTTSTDRCCPTRRSSMSADAGARPITAPISATSRSRQHCQTLWAMAPLRRRPSTAARSSARPSIGLAARPFSVRSSMRAAPRPSCATRGLRAARKSVRPRPWAVRRPRFRRATTRTRTTTCPGSLRRARRAVRPTMPCRRRLRRSWQPWTPWAGSS